MQKTIEIKRTYGADIVLLVTGSYIRAVPLLEKVVTSAFCLHSKLQT